MKSPLLTFAALASLSLSGCNQQRNEGPSAAEALKAADASLQQAVAAKDLDKIMSFYADNAVLMPAAKPLISGKKAITDEWKHILAIPSFESTSKLAGLDVSSAPDLAYTMGSFQARMIGEDGDLVMEPGKWLSVWKKQPDGSWRIVVDTYNTDIPPPDHQ